MHYHICVRHHIRRFSCSTVGSSLDYCNSLLYGTSSKNITELQRLQNSLARASVLQVVKCALMRSVSQSRHWLPSRTTHHIQHAYRYLQSEKDVSANNSQQSAVWSFSQGVDVSSMNTPTAVNCMSIKNQIVSLACCRWTNVGINM